MPFLSIKESILFVDQCLVSQNIKNIFHGCNYNTFKVYLKQIKSFSCACILKHMVYI